jgi:hypothetical protein
MTFSTEVSAFASLTILYDKRGFADSRIREPQNTVGIGFCKSPSLSPWKSQAAFLEDLRSDSHGQEPTVAPSTFFSSERTHCPKR